MFEKLRPLRDCLLIKRIEENAERTAGGIYIPAVAKEERTQVGKVIAAGKGRLAADGTPIPLEVKEGDVVFFGKFSGTDAGKDLVILREEDVLGVIEHS